MLRAGESGARILAASTEREPNARWVHNTETLIQSMCPCTNYINTIYLNFFETRRYFTFLATLYQGLMSSLGHVNSDKSIYAISIQQDDLRAVFRVPHCCKVICNLQLVPYQISRRS